MIKPCEQLLVLGTTYSVWWKGYQKLSTFFLWIFNWVMVSVMMFNATFNNISVDISWRSVLSVEKTGILGENCRSFASHWQTVSHNLVLSTHRTHNFSGNMHWVLWKWMVICQVWSCTHHDNKVFLDLYSYTIYMAEPFNMKMIWLMKTVIAYDQIVLLLVFNTSFFLNLIVLFMHWNKWQDHKEQMKRV